MEKQFKYLLALIIAFLAVTCSSDKSTNPDTTQQNESNNLLVDSLATKETVALFKNLQTLSKTKLLFGHQFSTAYGIGWSYEFGRSDVLDVCGDYPAVYGWDIGSIIDPSSSGFDLSVMANLIKRAYNRGGINTISMHLTNPATDDSAFDNASAVPLILPGGSKHEKYIGYLDKIADYLLSLKASDGTLIPIIFRPYHEHNQTWSWWSKSACTEQEFIELWKMTIQYLRDEREVHNLLYVISPQDVSNQSDYLERYPGDDYVDILGLDYYMLYNKTNINHLENALTVVNNLAESKNKVSALTEIGIENLTIDDWFTKYLLAAVNKNGTTKNVAWALVWRNESTGHHFAPYPGHSSVPDFIQFYEDQSTAFESDLPEMYK